ncbi:MAG: hypothetical protein GXO66_01850 [Euryarchaeota archaeon]|nr:hypothetical protein [Euryarchaeota archaeon]
MRLPLLLLLLLIAGCIEEVEEPAPQEAEPEPLVVDLSGIELNETPVEEEEEEYAANITISLVTRHSARVSWVTAIPTESILLYGKDGEMNQSIIKPGRRTHHTVYLIALEPNTPYQLRVLVNLSNHTWESEVYNFTTAKLDPPRILNLSVNASHSWINLTWVLERPATAVVKLGTSPEELRPIYRSENASAEHSVLLGGVYPGRSYYLSVGGTERYSGYFETEPLEVATPEALLGDTLVRENLSITPLEFRKRHRTEEGYVSYVRLSFMNTGGDYLEYSIYAAIIDQWGRQFNLLRTSSMGDLSRGLLLPGAKREGFLLFEPVTRESTRNTLVIVYKNYTFEYLLPGR